MKTANVRAQRKRCEANLYWRALLQPRPLLKLHLFLMALGAGLMLVEGQVFELDGIRYVKVMHCFPKIIGGCIILSAAVSLYLRR